MHVGHVVEHRRAFADLYAGRAGELAEQMGRLREKEMAKRDSFKRAVERYIPGPVLGAMGLLAPPPHCQVSVAPPEAGLLHVSMEDLRRLPADTQVGALNPEEPLRLQCFTETQIFQRCLAATPCDYGGPSDSAR